GRSGGFAGHRAGRPDLAGDAYGPDRIRRRGSGWGLRSWCLVSSVLGVVTNLGIRPRAVIWANPRAGGGFPEPRPGLSSADLAQGVALTPQEVEEEFEGSAGDRDRGILVAPASCRAGAESGRREPHGAVGFGREGQERDAGLCPDGPVLRLRESSRNPFESS